MEQNLSHQADLLRFLMVGLVGTARASSRLERYRQESLERPEDVVAVCLAEDGQLGRVVPLEQRSIEPHRRIHVVGLLVEAVPEPALHQPALIDEDGDNLFDICAQGMMPKVYKQLVAIRNKLERHYKDMQDLEFTIQEGRLWLLQTRTGKRNGPAAVRMAVEMHASRLIDAKTAVQRVTPAQLDELLHPIVDPEAEKKATVIAKGLPAGPGGAVGQVVFTADDAVAWAEEGKKVILVREETNPEDVEGMRAAVAILTARGGMTSHAALVARGWGKCCIVGAGAIEVDVADKSFRVNGTVVREGEMITLNGTKGLVYQGELPLIVGTEENPYFVRFMKICDKVRRLGVRANADTPEDAERALKFGAEGIGLFRTEHMFYGKGSEEPLFKLRKMILSSSEAERRAALDELFPHVKADIKATLEVMSGKPVTIRLLDPPLHEFVPRRPEDQQRLADSLGISVEEIRARADALHEANPMMGHRGVRLGVSFPAISALQFRAIRSRIRVKGSLLRMFNVPSIRSSFPF